MDLGIRQFDHHCLWIKNCVGEDNKWIFSLLIFYATALTVLMFCALIYYYYDRWGKSDDDEDDGWDDWNLEEEEKTYFNSLKQVPFILLQLQFVSKLTKHVLVLVNYKWFLFFLGLSLCDKHLLLTVDFVRSLKTKYKGACCLKKYQFFGGKLFSYSVRFFHVSFNHFFHVSFDLCLLASIFS